jgi:hypothetical protein
MYNCKTILIIVSAYRLGLSLCKFKLIYLILNSIFSSKSAIAIQGDNVYASWTDVHQVVGKFY